MNERIPQAAWSGEFHCLGVVVHCHTLDTGQRIIETADLEALLLAMANDDLLCTFDEHEALRFARWRQSGETW